MSITTGIPATRKQLANMKVHETKVAGVLLLEPKVFGDERGFFVESYN